MALQMHHQWIPETSEELRKQAARLRQLAAHVYDRNLCDRLAAEAAALEARVNSISKS